MMEYVIPIDRKFNLWLSNFKYQSSKYTLELAVYGFDFLQKTKLQILDKYLKAFRLYIGLSKEVLDLI